MKITPETIPLPTDNQERPLWWLQDRLREELALGQLAQCACCGQDAKVYSRPINATMVKALRVISRSADGLDNGAIIAATRQKGGGNTSLMEHWGLVQRGPHKRWHVTPFGRRFLLGVEQIPSRVVLYNNIFLGFDSRRLVTVEDIDRGFDFGDVMSAEAVREAHVSP